MSACSSILIVDDDEEITQLLKEYLERFPFEVHIAHDADQMRAQLQAHPIDLVVMDVMLPGSDGLVLSREVRLKSRLPVIMLTARSSTIDRILGLDNGADDYMGKPFEPRELVSRIQTVLRRTAEQGVSHAALAQEDVVYFDGWELRRDNHTLLSPDGLVVQLSNAEFRLLTTFLQSPRRICSRDQLMERARGRNIDAYERSIDLLVSRLRQKLSTKAEQSLIQTVRGAGYVFNVQTVKGRMQWQS